MDRSSECALKGPLKSKWFETRCVLEALFFFRSGGHFKDYVGKGSCYCPKCSVHSSPFSTHTTTIVFISQTMKTRGPDKGTSSSEGPERGVEQENDERGMSDTYQGPVPNTSTKPLLLSLSMTSLDVNSAASKHKGDALILSGEPHTDLSPAMAVAEHKGTARYRELLYVYLAIVADAVTSNVMAPYAQEWVLHTFPTNNIGLYSGILVGSMAFARALSSPFLGWLSDSIGRRL